LHKAGLRIAVDAFLSALPNLTPENSASRRFQGLDSTVSQPSELRFGVGVAAAQIDQKHSRI
jgi:hypothetical protein